MASSRLKGITIEIGGDTSKLQKSLNAVNAPINKINKELNDLNKALKLDPKNTELLAQKQEVLGRNIEISREKLDKLKEAQRQMGSYVNLTEQQKEVYNRLSLEITKSEEAIKGMNKELWKARGIDLDKLQDGLKKVGEAAIKVSKAVAASITAASVAIVKIVKDGVNSYAKLEVAQKGSQRLFEDSFKTIEKNASQAYKSLGLSATEYYDQVNTYAVGLKNALGGSTERAAQLANDILVAQADIVAATGASQEQVQSAFAAVMRGNFTMIDNLRLGIKGSRQGMQEVINKVNEWNKAQGNATRYQMDNYADMQQALVDYVKMTGVAGTASTQMAQTIQGSTKMMKAAFDNFLNGSGSASDLSKTINIFLKNIFAAVKRLAPDIVRGLVKLVDELKPEILSMTSELLPIIIEGAQLLIEGLINFINNDTKQFMDMAIDILRNLTNFIIKNLPLILQAAIKIISELAIGIGQAAPELVPAVIECILTIIDTLIDNIDLLVNAAFQLVIGIGKGLVLGIPKIVEKIPQIISSLTKELKNSVSQFYKIGEELIEGMWKGIKGKWDYYKALGGGNGLQGWARKVVMDIKELFGIHSPSKLMRDEIGTNLGLGIVEGINDTVVDVENAMSNLSNKVEASVNPTINPTANSNPLYITIDKFYNNRETDIQQLAEELEFYRKNSALAKGGV